LDSTGAALLAAEAAEDGRARDVTVLDLRELTLVADYFVICSAPTSRQAKAIARRVEDRLAENDVRPLHSEGYGNALWILLDYGSFVVHVFRQTEREFYKLERLWGDAPVAYPAPARSPWPRGNTGAPDG